MTNQRHITPQDLGPKRSQLHWITVFGLGHMRPASGTWGSLPPVLFAACVIVVAHKLDVQVRTGPHDVDLLLWAVLHAGLITFLLLFSGACIAQGDAAEARFGKKDPGQAVADETAGQTLPLLAIAPATYADTHHALMAVAAAFFIFRILDIIKPWPARSLQRIPGGWGILIDDLFAGGYAAIAMVFLCRTPWLS
jgi:phosphatidylglycerophosphatase A